MIQTALIVGMGLGWSILLVFLFFDLDARVGFAGAMAVLVSAVLGLVVL